MYSIRPKKQYKNYSDVQKLDKRKHVECHPDDPDAFKVMRVVDLDDGGEHIYYEFYKSKKGINKEDSVWNNYIKSELKRKKKNGK